MRRRYGLLISLGCQRKFGAPQMETHSSSSSSSSASSSASSCSLGGHCESAIYLAQSLGSFGRPEGSPDADVRRASGARPLCSAAAAAAAPSTMTMTTSQVGCKFLAKLKPALWPQIVVASRAFQIGTQKARLGLPVVSSDGWFPPSSCCLSLVRLAGESSLWDVFSGADVPVLCVCMCVCACN